MIGSPEEPGIMVQIMRDLYQHSVKQGQTLGIYIYICSIQCALLFSTHFYLLIYYAVLIHNFVYTFTSKLTSYMYTIHVHYTLYLHTIL